MDKRIILILALVALVAGCGGSASSGGRTDVVAAFYPLAFAAERVGGDGVSVTNLTAPGAEPHDLELSARDVEHVRSADFVFYLGSGFQPALERAVEGVSGEAVDVLAGFDLHKGGGHEGGENAGVAPSDASVDPHVWLDPLRYTEVVERIGVALGRPQAARAMQGELEQLDEQFRTGLRACARREIVTSHAGFGYLAERYGLDQIALTGLSPEAEPTPRELEQVIAEVREHGATTVFFETLVSPRLADTVARESGTRTAVLNPLEGLTKEELERGEDYFSVMRANLAALRKALGCR
jgi:zinc transport system substrate-binding protein